MVEPAEVARLVALRRLDVRGDRVHAMPVQLQHVSGGHVAERAAAGAPDRDAVAPGRPHTWQWQVTGIGRASMPKEDLRCLLRGVGAGTG